MGNYHALMIEGIRIQQQGILGIIMEISLYMGIESNYHTVLWKENRTHINYLEYNLLINSVQRWMDGKVSELRGTPIAGWFISPNILLKLMISGYPCFRKLLFVA